MSKATFFRKKLNYCRLCTLGGRFKGFSVDYQKHKIKSVLTLCCRHNVSSQLVELVPTGKRSKTKISSPLMHAFVVRTNDAIFHHTNKV